jgi:hypothetical protein
MNNNLENHEKKIKDFLLNNEIAVDTDKMWTRLEKHVPRSAKKRFFFGPLLFMALSGSLVLNGWLWSLEKDRIAKESVLLKDIANLFEKMCQ